MTGCLVAGHRAISHMDQGLDEVTSSGFAAFVSHVCLEQLKLQYSLIVHKRFASKKQDSSSFLNVSKIIGSKALCQHL